MRRLRSKYVSYTKSKGQLQDNYCYPLPSVLGDSDGLKGDYTFP